MLPFTVPLKTPQEICLENNNAVENIRQFRQEFNLICSLTGLDAASEDVRFRFMYLTMGRAARQIIENLVHTMPDSERRRVDAILSRLESYFLPATHNILFERRKFYTITHEAHESIEDYASRLWHQVATCHFENNVDQVVRDRFISGLQNDSLIDFILQKTEGSNSTFNEVCNLAKLWCVSNVRPCPATPTPVQILAPTESTQPIQIRAIKEEVCIPAVSVKSEPPELLLDNTVPIKEELMLPLPIQVPLPTPLPPPSQSPKLSRPLPPLLPLLTSRLPLPSQPPPLPSSRSPSSSGDSSAIKRPNNSSIVSCTVQLPKFKINSFIVLKKDKEESNPVIWRVDGATLVEKYLPYRASNTFRSSAQFRNWDHNTYDDYVTVDTSFPRKEKTEEEEFTIVQLKEEIFKSLRPRKRMKFHSKRKASS